MCILSLFKQKDKFILTFNRDEQLNRASEFPKWIDASVFCPIDSLKGGTWIGYNGKSLYCLQNGGLEPHIRDTNYTISRGLMLINVLKNEKFDLYQAIKDQHVEPFTITQFQIENESLISSIYNGHELNKIEIPFNEPYINCSSTLYNSFAKEKIKDYFIAKSRIDFDENDILNWHKNMMIGAECNHYTNKVNTVSICQFVISNDSVECSFFDVKDSVLKRYIV